MHKLKEIVILKGKAELQERKINNSLIHNLQVIVYDEIKDYFQKLYQKILLLLTNWVYYKNNENNSLLFNI